MIRCVLIRPAGTEPLIRVMAQSESAAQVAETVAQLCETVAAVVA